MTAQGVRTMEKDTRRKLLALLFQNPDKDEIDRVIKGLSEHQLGIKAEWDFIVKRLNETTLFNDNMSIKNLKIIRGTANEISSRLRLQMGIETDQPVKEARELRKTLTVRLNIEKLYAKMVEECLVGNKKSIEAFVKKTNIKSMSEKNTMQMLLSNLRTEFSSGKWFMGERRELLGFQGEIYEKIVHMVDCFSRRKGLTKFYRPADPEELKTFQYNKIKNICINGTPEEMKIFLSDMNRDGTLDKNKRMISSWMINLDMELRSAELFDWKDHINENMVDRAYENVKELCKEGRRIVGLGLSMPDINATEIVMLHAQRLEQCLKKERNVIAMPCREKVTAPSVGSEDKALIMTEDKALIMTKMIFYQNYYGSNDGKINMPIAIEPSEVESYTEALSEVYKEYVITKETPKAMRAFVKTKIFIYGKAPRRSITTRFKKKTR